MAVQGNVLSTGSVSDGTPDSTLGNMAFLWAIAAALTALIASAIWDGVRRDYSKSHKVVVALSTIEEQ